MKAFGRKRCRYRHRSCPTGATAAAGQAAGQAMVEGCCRQ